MEPREYVAEQLSIIVGAPVALTDAQAARFWALLTRREESRAPADQHGNYQHTESVLSRMEMLEQPPLDDEIASLVASVKPIIPRWPNGHRFAACLTHDVDSIIKRSWQERLRQAAILRGRVSPLLILRSYASFAANYLYALAGFSDRATYDFWLEEEGQRGFHSTFFVLPERLDQPVIQDHCYRYDDSVELAGMRMTFAEATRKVSELGWEIGLHGSYASAFDKEIICADREQIEAMLGHPISAVRQHFLRFNVDQTPRIQQSAGFTADSTLGYSRTIGCRAGLTFPFFWPELDLLEVPLIIQDVGLLRNGRPHNLQQAIARASALIRRIAEVGGVATLSWHTHPESPGGYACYRALLDLIAELNGWGCSVGELNAWWRQRRTALYPDIMRLLS